VHEFYAFAEALDLSPSDFLLPANDSGARAKWDEVLPNDLKPRQKEQIARLLAEPRACLIAENLCLRQQLLVPLRQRPLPCLSNAIDAFGS
jgi:hypothetical protein